MAIIVQKIEGVWQRAVGIQTIQRTDIEAQEVISMAVVSRLVDEGVWGADDLAKYGLATAAPFEVPAGKVRIGSPSYVETDEGVVEVYELDDEPPPSPPPTPEEKLEALGLTADDIRTLLGLD